MADKTLSEQTSYVMDNPKAGDVFTEMFSFWVFVVYRKEDVIRTVVAHGGNTVPPQGKAAETTLEKFQKRFQYDSPAMRHKYWVTLTKRKADVSEFIKYWDKFERDFGYEDEPQICQAPKIIKNCGLTKTHILDISTDIFDMLQSKSKITKVKIRNTITNNLLKNKLLIDE